MYIEKRLFLKNNREIILINLTIKFLLYSSKFFRPLRDSSYICAIMSKEVEQNSFLKSAAVNGGYIGVAMLILILLERLFGANMLIALLSYAIPFGGVALYTIRYRDASLGGYINYWTAVKYGVLLCVFAGVIAGAGSAVMNIILPEYLDDYLQNVVKVYQQYAGENEMQAFIKVSNYMKKPFFFFIMSIISYGFMGVFISILTSLMVQRKKF